MQRFWSTVRVADQADLAARCQRIDCLVLVAVGGKDPCASPDSLRRCFDGCRNKTIALIPGIGQQCHREAPVTFNYLLDRFIAEFVAANEPMPSRVVDIKTRASAQVVAQDNRGVDLAA